MTAVGELVLLLGLLLAAHCDVRARDPEVEEEEEATARDSYGGAAAAGGGGGGAGGVIGAGGHYPPRGAGWDPHALPIGGFGAHPHPHPHLHPHNNNNNNSPHPHPHGQGHRLGHGHEASGSAHHSRGDQQHLGHGHVKQGQHKQGQEADWSVADTAAAAAGGGDASANGDNSGPQMMPARTGNWCAFVHRRAVTMVVSCGTEKYTIKSQSPCPSGSPDCQIIMYKLSTRPVYREKQKIFTALLWRCCPGHGGENCDDEVPEGQVTDPESPDVVGRTHPGGPLAHHLGPDTQPQLIRDQSWEQQSDFGVSGGQLYEARGTPPENDTSADLTYDYPHHPPSSEHDHGQHTYDRQVPVTVDLDVDGLPSYSGPPGLQDLPQVAAIILAQLQPLLDGFNSTLQRLSLEVSGLSRDVAELKRKHEDEAPAAEEEEAEEERGDQHAEDRGGTSGADPDLDGDADHHDHRDPDPEGLGHMPDERQQELDEYTMSRYEYLESKLEEGFQYIAELQRSLDGRLHDQRAFLTYNLTSFKTDIDGKIKRQQKNLQQSLAALNSSISDLRQNQDRLEEQLQLQGGSWQGIPIERPVIPAQDQTAPPAILPGTTTHHDTDPLWVAITRLDERVVNNTVRLDGLGEGLRVTDDSVRKLQEDMDTLEEKIKNTGLESQIKFMETGLEVDAARTVVLQRVDELASNLTMQSDALGEMENDMDYLYKQLYAHANLSHTLARMQEAISHVDALAKQNRDSLQQGHGHGHPQGHGLGHGTGHAKPEGWYDLLSSVEDLKQGMGHVQNSLAFEQERTRVLNSNVSLLQTALAVCQQDVLALQTKEDQKEGKVKYLENSFSSLLKDAVRHAEVLEVILGMEVLEFMELPEKQRMLHSIPATLKMLQELKEQLKTEAADQPSSVLDAAPSGVVAKLQAEVDSLSRGLENHLQEFKSLFSNTEGLSGSEVSVDLDKLSEIMRRKEAKQQRRQQRKASNGRRDTEHVSHRNKRDASLETMGSQTANLAFISSTKSGFAMDGPLIFEDIMSDRGNLYSIYTGLFRAPVKGLYLFVVTLDFGPGTSLARLVRGDGIVAASLHQSSRRPAGPATRVCLLHMEQGEQLYLELSQGTLEENKPEDNTFAGILLYQTI
ncbi:multimerin-2a [Engraulis encrasicolus]|uniref:multimerin-2a n=1 Tax=Engraulis encrasicolus TaxID=184585 RepID=UPI002FD4C84C